MFRIVDYEESHREPQGQVPLTQELERCVPLIWHILPTIFLRIEENDVTLQSRHDRERMARREMKYGNESRFCGNIIYDGSSISQILVDGGYITFDEETDEPLYHFYITDHQGNNRVVVDADGNVEERNHYYPYGALMSSSTTSIQRYKYNGKELNQHSYMLWYDYMARQTMPILGRFCSVDPLCEKYIVCG